MALRSHRDIDGNASAFVDDVTFERVLPLKTIAFKEDFLGAEAALATSANLAAPFIAKLVQSGGTPTAARVANAVGGVVRLALDATSEKQESTLYFADSLEFDVTKGFEWEARVNLHVLPSAAQVEMVWGAQTAWIDGPDNAARYIQFQALASGAVNIRTKDGTNTVSNASGVTVVADGWHLYRIDATDPTNIQFFIDGVKVSPTAAASYMAFAATGTNAVLQPYFSVYKASGTGVGSMDIDVVRAWSNRV